MKIKQKNIIANIVVIFAILLLVSCGDIRELENKEMNGLQQSEPRPELTSLVINHSEVIDKMAPHVSEYTVYVNYDVEKVELFASFTKNALMIINGVESSGKEMLELKSGDSQFEIQIKNGLEMRGYHLVMVRKSN